MKATLSNFKQSPRKVRLVADMIRGKRVDTARDLLTFMPKKSSPELAKLLNSAVANARQSGLNADDLFVKTISVDKGLVIRRFKPMARGRAAGIRRTMSIVRLELGTIGAPVEKKAKKAEKSEKTEEKATTQKPAKKSRAKKAKAE